MQNIFSTPCCHADSGENGVLHNVRQKAHPTHGDAQAIACRQARHQHELNAINQRFVHARMLKHRGLDRPAQKKYAQSVSEMKHTNRPMDRIFPLDGPPILQDLG